MFIKHINTFFTTLFCNLYILNTRLLKNNTFWFMKLQTLKNSTFIDGTPDICKVFIVTKSQDELDGLKLYNLKF